MTDVTGPLELPGHPAESAWQRWRPAAARRWRQARTLAGRGIGRARAWRVHLALPGLAGAVLAAIAAAGITNWLWHGLGPWIGVGVASFFCLRLDSRL